MTTFNLKTLRLRPGEGFRDDLPVELEPLELGGQEYVPSPSVPTAELRITRTTSGLLLELGFESSLAGPCVRCLEPASVELRIRAREYHERGASSEELVSPYVDGDRLDLSSWARDALAVELPEQILCSESCAGLCGGCGANLNAEGCSCPPAEPDGRFAKLAELRDRLS